MKHKSYKDKYRIIGKISMISNLNFAIFCALCILGGILIWKYNVQNLFLFIAFCVIFSFTSFANIQNKKKLLNLKLLDDTKLFAKQIIKQSYFIFIPFIEIVTTTRLRSKIWNDYISGITKDIKSEKELWKTRINILEELKLDGFISNLKYDKLKLTYQEELNKLIKNGE